MVRKLIRFGIPVAIGALAATQWQDITRYVKIKQMSLGAGGRPQNVPAVGKTAYPVDPASGAADGRGDFASPQRGGPQ